MPFFFTYNFVYGIIEFRLQPRSFWACLSHGHIMKFLAKIFWVIVFIAFFGFALKNDQIVTLHYFWGYQTSAPLVILLLGFFVLGAVFCLVGMAPMVFRHRRDISRHKKTIAEIEKEREAAQQAANQAPAPDVIRHS